MKKVKVTKTQKNAHKCIWYKCKEGTCQMDNQMCKVRGCDGFETEEEARKG